MNSLKEVILLVLNYLSALEIWPDKTGGHWWEWLNKRETTVLGPCGQDMKIILYGLKCEVFNTGLPWWYIHNIGILYSVLKCTIKIFKRYKRYILWYRYRFMMFNTTFNNISVISWLIVLLMEETERIRKNPPTCHSSLTNFIT